MLDHLGIQCADIAVSAAFYDAVLAPLGATRLMDFGVAIGYGVAPKPDFWIGSFDSGEGFRESHIAFAAPDRDSVRTFFETAVAAGAEVLHEPAPVARVPRGLLRRLRARSRRQQRRGGVPRPRRVVMSFTPEEAAYLASQPLARLATRTTDGQPDVVPVGFEFDGERFWVGGPGETVLTTRKFRNVMAGNEQVALVVDDLVSLDPFVARGIRVYGLAGQPVERDGMVGPGTYMPIVPVVSWSWNMAGEPVGDEWYESRRQVWM